MAHSFDTKFARATSIPVVLRGALQMAILLFASIFLACSIRAQGVAIPSQSTTTSTSSTSTSSSTTSTPSICEKLAEEGQPACGEEAGNPINVTTGNKFQREVDMPPLPGVLGLELIRHYNSSASRLSDAPSMFGRGWRLSYDWALRFDHANKNETMLLVRGDGTQLALRKNRPSINQSVLGTSWHAIGAVNGQLKEQRKALDSEYLWTESSGQRYRFNSKGWLTSIEASTGEFLTIEREHKGDITKVTDPQGRSLNMTLLSDDVALRTKRFGGVQIVDTPVGRYEYRYGGVLPEGSKIDPVRISSRLIAVEHARIKRHYLFEDAQRPTLLTGIRVEGAGSDSVTMNQRIATWTYDAQGRAVMSMKGDQERVTLLFLPKLKNPQGLETGATVLTNSLGRSTLYRYQMLAGKPHLTEVVGPGCASCGQTNVRHEYDSNGRLLQTTYLAPAIIRAAENPKTSNALVHAGLKTELRAELQAGQPLRAIRMNYDQSGRPTHRYLIPYLEGKPEKPQLQTRLEYDAGSIRDGESPNRPTLIARPSVVPGQEHRLELSYNDYGQVTLARETGFDPIAGEQISRATRYKYQLIQGRSVLVEADGPLPNGPMQSPVDSDISLFKWDHKGDRVVAVIEPLGFINKRSFDDAGRLVSTRFDDGARRSQRDLSYSSDGRHAMSVIRSAPSGWLLKPVVQGIPMAVSVDPVSIVSSKEAGEKEAGEVDEASRMTKMPYAYKYDALGRLTQTIDAAGRTITRGYDEANRQRTLSDDLGNRSLTDFDTEGRPRHAGLYRAGQSQLLRAAYFWHDDDGRPTKRLLPDGRMDTWRYGQEGRMTEHIDGDDIRTSFLKAKGNPAEAVIRQAIDGDVQFHLRSGDASAARTQVVDDFGRIVKTKLADHGDKLARYDEANRITKLIHADQSSVSYLYDQVGRLVQEFYEDAKGTNQGRTQLIYEGALLSKAIDPEQTTQTHYDALGRKTGESVQIKGLYQTFHTTQRYDEKTGLIQQRGLVTGQVMLVSREAASLGASVKAIQLQSAPAAWILKQAQRLFPKPLSEKLARYFPPETIVEGIQVDPFDGLKSFKAGNGLSTERSFDLAGRMTKQVTPKIGNTHYEYQVGPRIRAIDRRPMQDKTAPIVQASMSNRDTFNYSGFGSLQKVEVSNNGFVKVASSAMSTPANKALVVSAAVLEPSRERSTSPTRDPLGRVTDDGKNQYAYTARGQIAEVRNKLMNQVLSTYRYDSQGHRIAKTVHSGAPGKSKSETTYFLWQDNHLVAEINQNGKVTSQYFYLSVADTMPQALPVAKWESEANTDNKSRKDRFLFIHADHRGAPVAMTDRAQSVVWAIDEAENLWGRAKTSLGTATLNLRLPGQYFDAESGLHDNFNRTYDPHTGRYLQPDPLGYPDGPDPYVYASGDPVNKVDPLGLYAEDVHYYLTYFLSRMAGLSAASSLNIAQANQFIDNNFYTQPFHSGTVRMRYHFTYTEEEQTKERSTYPMETRYLNAGNEQTRFLRLYAILAPTDCSKEQFYGEFLHAYMDTYAHRNELNAPYDFLGGHVIALGSPGHGPDTTYDWIEKPLSKGKVTGNFRFQDEKALALEESVFNRLQADIKKDKKLKPSQSIEWATVQEVLIQFNAVEVSGDIGNFSDLYGSPQNSVDLTKLAIEKLKILQSALERFGFESIPNYSVAKARSARIANLVDAQGKPFLGVSYPKAILTTD